MKKWHCHHVDWPQLVPGLANLTVDASDRLVQPLPPLAVLSPDLDSGCASELVKESPTDSAIVCDVGVDALDNT